MTHRTTMKLLALTLLLAGCATSTETGKDGCYTAEDAFSTYDSIRAGIKDGTATEADSSAAMKKIHDKLADVASFAKEPLKTHAEAAALAAGRIRVALAGGEGDVSSEVDNLNVEIHAAADYCHS